MKMKKGKHYTYAYLIVLMILFFVPNSRSEAADVIADEEFELEMQVQDENGNIVDDGSEVEIDGEEPSEDDDNVDESAEEDADVSAVENVKVFDADGNVISKESSIDVPGLDGNNGPQSGRLDFSTEYRPDLFQGIGISAILFVQELQKRGDVENGNLQDTIGLFQKQLENQKKAEDLFYRLSRRNRALAFVIGPNYRLLGEAGRTIEDMKYGSRRIIDTKKGASNAHLKDMLTAFGLQLDNGIAGYDKKVSGVRSEFSIFGRLVGYFSR